MATKYIVNNVTGQTITGDLTINGNVTITGSSNSNSIATYRALLTQTGPITGTTISDFSYALIKGETYTITSYVVGDDFSNIANVQNGNINETGCVFIATGETPTIFLNGSQLVSNGALVVDVLENSLGYSIIWSWNPYGGYGYYIAFNDDFGPMYNNVFPRNSVEVTAQLKIPFDWGAPKLLIFSGPTNFMGKDNVISLQVFDFDINDIVDNALYYTPVEIKIKQDNTPVIISGNVVTSYPINNVSINLFCDGNLTETYYTSVDGINNITELVNTLNTQSETNFLGVYSNNGQGGIQLTMKKYLKDIFCQDGTLTFEVFND